MRNLSSHKKTAKSIKATGNKSIDVIIKCKEEECLINFGGRMLG
jgi:hypothetical protein